MLDRKRDFASHENDPNGVFFSQDGKKFNVHGEEINDKGEIIEESLRRQEIDKEVEDRKANEAALQDDEPEEENKEVVTHESKKRGRPGKVRNHTLY